MLITTSVIFIGIKIFDFEISYSNCIKIVMLSESIFLIASFFKTFYFYLYPPINIEAIQNFVPFGISNILYSVSIPKYLNVLLQYISLFEICYWLFLAFGIKIFGNINFKKSLKIICLSYGAAMLIWCIFIVFIQLQFN